MKDPLEGVSATERTILQDDLLCIADTKLVLGNWFAECVMNGKSLPDFAAMLGMCTASYGQTRAIYHYLDTGDHSYRHLERGRGADEIRSMNLLDEPPAGWPDFIVSTWLAEQATWALAAGFLHNPDRTVAGIARRIGEEAYFHLKYATGWIRIIASSAGERARAEDALGRRYPLAQSWFGPAGADDELFAAGLRDDPVSAIRAGFAREVADGAEPLVAGGPPAGAAADRRGVPDGWRPEARRAGPLPAGLFEVIRFKDEELAR